MNFRANESAQKLRGGYYTSLDLAVFLSRWVKEIKPANILEPSCGDGIFFEALAKVGGFANSTVTGLELDEDEAAKSARRVRGLLPKARIVQGDYLGWATEEMRGNTTFDAILGNPPFIRYQYLPEKFQARAAQIFSHLNLDFTKHTNAWVPFIAASLAMLRPGGRLAMVVPSEIIHVAHAGSLRAFLGRECRRVVIVDPQEIWFGNTLQGAVLLMAEKRRGPKGFNEGVGIYPVQGKEFLKLNPSEVFNAPKLMNTDVNKGKWTYALLASKMRSILSDLANQEYVKQFIDIAAVDVGIVTGANDFFLVDDDTVQEYGLEKWSHPMFGRSGHCPGVIYDARQHAENAQKGYPTNFIWFPDKSAAKDAAARKYIAFGERQKLNTRYKCSVRKPWYSVPSVHATEIGMLKRSSNTPRLIVNKLNAFTTDTAYRIKPNSVSGNVLVGNFVNSLTSLSAELEGRHYGGGVLELVPSEIERLLIPMPKGVKINIKELDYDVRTLSTEAVLGKQDRKLLGDLGLTATERELIFENWINLRNRRQRTASEQNNAQSISITKRSELAVFL